MKQKLLLALFVLFASVGAMRAADIAITVPAKSSATISWSLTSGGAVPELKDGVTPIPVSGTSVAAKNETDAAVVYSFTGQDCKTLTIAGKSTVVAFSTTMNTLETLSLNSLGLESLTLGNFAPNLKSLSCTDNKLSVIPTKGSIATYNVGTQSPTITEPTTAGSAANKPTDLTLASLQLSSIVTGNQGFTVVSNSWKLKGDNGYVSTSNAKAATGVNNRYYFKTGSSADYGTNDVYMHGMYSCDIKFNDNSDYPGVTIKNIPVKVEPATYTLTQKDKNVKLGTILVYNGSASINFDVANGVKKGDVLTFIPSPESGYAFKEFQIEGMNYVEGSHTEGNDSYQYEVLGTVTPTIKAVFTAQTIKVKFARNVNGGIVQVFANTKEVSTDENVAFNSDMTIVATPNAGWVVSKSASDKYNLYVNSEVIDGVAGYEVTGDNKTNVVTAKFKAAKDISSIGATFLQDNQKKLVIFFPHSKLGTGDFNINGTQGTDAGSADYTAAGLDNTKWQGKQVTTQYNTQQLIKFKTSDANTSVTSIIANGNPVEYSVASTDATGLKTYVIDKYTMLNTDVTMIINTSTTVAPTVGMADNQRITYDGTSKAIVYTTTPANLPGVKLEYKLTSAADAFYTTTQFTDANTGTETYTVRYSRAADANYSAVAPTVKTFTIVAAKPEITTLPVVNVVEDKTTTPSTFKYSVTTGVAKYKRGTSMIEVKGKWEIIEGTNVIEKITDASKQKNAHSVTVRFTATNANSQANTNIEVATIMTEAKVGGKGLDNVNVEVLTSKLPTGAILVMKNGNNVLTAKTTVKADTQITFEGSVPGYSTYKVFQTDNTGATITGTDLATGGIKATGAQMYFIIVGETAKNLGELELVLAKKIGDYSGTPILFDQTTATEFKVIKKATPATVVSTGFTFTYQNEKSGESTVSPINAGTYIVNISRSEDANYKAFKATGKLIINQIKPAITKEPVASRIGKGQSLSQSVLDGASTVAGKFVWDTPNDKLLATAKKNASFVPDDLVNYLKVGFKDISVEVTDDLIITIATDQNGKVTVKDSKGIYYKSGDAVVKGTSLTVETIADPDYEIESLIVDGTSSTNASYTFTMPDYTVAISATFRVKTLIDPSTQYTVTLPTKNAVKGVVVNKPGINAVKKDAAFSFTLSHLAIDRPIVKANEVVLTPSEAGVYSIAKVAANTTVTVALAAPTKIKVGVEKITKNSKGFKLGSVQVQGLAADSSCYYGDVITLVAFPESGVTFYSWSDVTNADNPRSVTVTTGMTIKPQFTGTPTGIADIEGTKVYGAEGYIYVSCEGQATVTVVTMDGRSQQVRIAGEARIETGAGIYGVILQQGTEVLKTKVVVR